MEIRDGWTDDAPIDLSALNPDLDSAAEARLVQGILLGRRQRYPVPFGLLVSVWATDRRALIGAAMIAALAMVAVGTSTRRSDAGPLTVAESIGVPAEFLGQSAVETRREQK